MNTDGLHVRVDRPSESVFGTSHAADSACPVDRHISRPDSAAKENRLRMCGGSPLRMLGAVAGEMCSCRIGVRDEGAAQG